MGDDSVRRKLFNYSSVPQRSVRGYCLAKQYDTEKPGQYRLRCSGLKAVTHMPDILTHVRRNIATLIQKHFWLGLLLR